MRVRLLSPLLLLLTAAHPASAWRTDVAGTPSPSRPLDVAAAAGDTVVAAGRVAVEMAGDDAIAVCLGGADGAEHGRHVVAGTDPAANDVYRRVVPAGGGTVFVVGRVLNVDTGADALVSRLDVDDCAPVWDTQRDGGEGLTDDAQDVAVHGASGDAIVVGRLESGNGLGGFAVWRVADDSGDVVWTTHLGEATVIGRRVALSGDAVYVVGEADAPAGDDDVLVARLNVATGDVVWTQTVAGDAEADDDAVAIGFAVGKVIVLATTVQTATGPDGTVVALSAGSGTQLWRAALDGTASGDDDQDELDALALAPNGDPIVTGAVSNTGTGNDLVVARLDAEHDGDILWRSERDGGNEANDEARAIAFATLGTADGAFVTGRLREPGVGGQIAVLRLDANNGTDVWRRSIEGGDDRNDIGLALVVDASGDVIVGGRARRADTGDEFAVIKRSGASGGSFPCGNGTLDAGEECDDANPVRGDGCRPDCTVEACGDGIVDPAEDCDDPAAVCCTPACTFAPTGSPCDDGDACTQIDGCIEGTCLGTMPVVCPVPGQCESVACDPTDGACVTTARPDATTCDDGDRCTRADQCRSGICESGIPEVCDDFDPCTIDACDPLLGCTATPLDGVPAVACALDPARIDRQCGTAIPRVIERRLAKTATLLEKADASTKDRRTRRLLTKASRKARKGARKTQRLRDRSRIPFVCADAVIDVLTEVENRALILRHDF